MVAAEDGILDFVKCIKVLVELKAEVDVKDKV